MEKLVSVHVKNWIFVWAAIICGGLLNEFARPKRFAHSWGAASSGGVPRLRRVRWQTYEKHLLNPLHDPIQT